VLATINAGLAQQGLMLKTGTVVDATIIAAPSSTKNKDGERDPEMHQTKKGNQWHFGMKAHIGVDAESGLVHTVIGTAANVNDVTQAAALLHGEEKVVFADARATRVWQSARRPRTWRWTGTSRCARASAVRWTRRANCIGCWTRWNSSRPA
jgi:IS5 family transposase